MQENMPIVARKMMHIMRIALLMLRKGLISKKKLVLDLNLMMKRGKLAGKALTNIMFHHHHHNNHRGGATTHGGSHPTLQEFEFSCSNTPLYPQYFPNKRPKQCNYKKETSMITPLSLTEYEDMIEDSNLESVKKVLNRMVANGAYRTGLGPNPSPVTGRQVRITDSPFPDQGSGLDNCLVDQAADEFIQRFYSQLKQQI